MADTAPYWAHALRTLYRDRPESFYPYQLQAFLGVLLVLALPVALSGAVLPLMFHALRDRVRDLGDVAGRLYSWNTLGSLLGALIGGYALLFWLDLHHIFRIAMAAIAVAAVLTTLQRLSRSDGSRPHCSWPWFWRASRCSRPGGRSSSPRASSASATRSPTPSAAPRPSSAATGRARCSSTTTIPSPRWRSRPSRAPTERATSRSSRTASPTARSRATS